MRTPLRLCVGFGAAILTTLAMTGTALAAPPANDDFANPQSISALAPYAGSNVDSTTETATSPTEAQRLQSLTGWGIFNTTWHEWTAPGKGDVTFVVCSTFATNVILTTGSAVDTVSLPSMVIGNANRQGTSLAGPAHPSGCASNEYVAELGTASVESGTVLRPVVSSAFNGTTGSYTIATIFTAAPTNDAFADRIELFSRHTRTGSNVASTTEANESNNPYANYRTVWYEYEAPGTSNFDLSLCSTFAANLVVYSGSSLPVTPLRSAQGSTADTCGTGKYLTQLTTVNVNAGDVLKIQVGGFNGQTFQGTFDITASFNGVPANDEWSSATDLGSADTAIAYGDNTNATVGQPHISVQYPQGSVWYKWTAPDDAPVEVNACTGTPSGYDGYLAVFSSSQQPPSSHNDLSQIATDDDSCVGDRPSMPSLSFNATAGQTYWIAFALTISNPNPSFTEFTLSLEAGEYDADSDGYADNVDDCPNNANESPKTNGCPVEQLVNSVAPSLSGFAGLGETLTTTNGTWTMPGHDPNVTAPTFAYQWQRCNSEASVCADISGADEQSYTQAQDDIGQYLRAVVTATNEDDSATAASNNFGPIPDPPDSDGDGVFDPFDDCINGIQGSGKTNGCPTEEISVTADPAISGTSVVGAQFSVSSLGTATNNPDLDASVADPTVGDVFWRSCSSATNVGTCQTRTATGSGLASVYTATAADVGRFIRIEVVWSNGEGTDQSGWSVAGAAITQPATPAPPPASPPAPIDPLTLAVKKSLGTVKRDKKGVFTFKGAVVTCGATATGPCTGTFAISAKVGKKTVKYGVGKTGQASGKSAAVTFKPSSKLAKAIKKAKGKKLKVTLVFSVSAPGFPAQTATATAVLK